MSEEYYPEIHQKIYPEREKLVEFQVQAKLSRKGKTAKLESVDNPASVFYCQFGVDPPTNFVIARFEVPMGNYFLSVNGEDRRENVTVFPNQHINRYEW